MHLKNLKIDEYVRDGGAKCVMPGKKSDKSPNLKWNTQPSLLEETKLTYKSITQLAFAWKMNSGVPKCA